MIFKSGGPQGDLNGFLDAGSHLTGELTFEASFRVDGKLSGKISSRGSLIVGESGEIDGEIHVGQVFVSGTVRGTVTAGERLQIAAGGKVFAEITTPSLVIEDGGLFEGRCSMVRERAPAAVVKPGPGLVKRAAGE